MFGVRRKIIEPTSKDEFLIIQKAYGCLPKALGINPSDVLNYVIVKDNKDGSYDFIDNEGETDGFNSFKGAEQFLRAYILDNYDEIPHRWYLNEFPKAENGILINQNGEEVDF